MPRLPVGAKGSLQPVAARLGHDVDQAALEVAVLGAGTESANLDLLDPAGTRLQKITADAGMVHGHPVELIVVGLRGGRSPDLVGPGPRSERHQRLRVIGKRQERQVRRREPGSEFGVAGADVDRGRLDHQRVQRHHGGSERDDHRLGPSGADQDVVHHHRAVADAAHRHPIGPRGKERQPESAPTVRHSLPAGEAVGMSRNDVGEWYRGACPGLNASFENAAVAGLRRGRSRDDEEARGRQCEQPGAPTHRRITRIAPFSWPVPKRCIASMPRRC